MQKSVQGPFAELVLWVMVLAISLFASILYLNSLGPLESKKKYSGLVQGFVSYLSNPLKLTF